RRDFPSRIPECSRPPALAGTDGRTTGNKGMLRGRSRDIYHDDFALAERQRRVRRE
ncbi:hypothetical protein EV363DRAFT_1178405, partial [Boletus edulis]